MNKDAVAEMSQRYQVETAQQLVPKGYKQTEVGVIPEDWECVALGEIGQSIIGLTYSPSNVSDFGTLVLRSSNVQKGQLSYKDNVYVQMDLPDRVITKEGDILICVRNGSRQLIGKCALIDNTAAGHAFGAFMTVFRTKAYEFIFYQFQSSVIQHQIEETMGATINQITNKDMSGFKVAIPTLKSEQAAIANALSDTDALLSELEKLIAKKQAIKTATMQQLLTGRTRLPQFAHHPDGSKKGYKQSELGEIPEDWEILAFSSLAKPSSVRVNPKLYGGGDFCIELEHISQGGGYLTGSTQTNSTSSLKSVFEEGDVLFGKLRAYLKKYWLARKSGVCSTEIWVLRAEQQKSISGFIFFVVQTDRFIEEASEAYGTHMPRSDWNVMSQLPIATPSIEEQTAIATILSDMDSEIQALEQRLIKTRQIKQGMMQELLTGKTRLV